jgi:hypothetical protein
LLPEADYRGKVKDAVEGGRREIQGARTNGADAAVSGLRLVLMGLVPRVSGKGPGIWRSDIPERERAKRKNSEVESNSTVLAWCICGNFFIIIYLYFLGNKKTFILLSFMRVQTIYPTELELSSLTTI